MISSQDTLWWSHLLSRIGRVHWNARTSEGPEQLKNRMIVSIIVIGVSMLFYPLIPYVNSMHWPAYTLAKTFIYLQSHCARWHVKTNATLINSNKPRASHWCCSKIISSKIGRTFLTRLVLVYCSFKKIQIVCNVSEKIQLNAWASKERLWWFSSAGEGNERTKRRASRCLHGWMAP